MNPAEFKRIREELDLTQTELAELLGLSGRNPVTLYEMGKRRPSALIIGLMRLFNEESEKYSLELRKKLKEYVRKARSVKSKKGKT